MKNLLFFLATCLPATIFAHPSLAPHEHHGLLNGWELYALIPALLLVIVFISKRMLSKSRVRK